MKKLILLSTLTVASFSSFAADYGVELLHAWGMTETSPVATLNQFLQRHSTLSDTEKTELRTGQGRPLFGVELRLLDENGEVLPHDGKTQGDLQVRGHWIAKRYYGKDTDSLTMTAGSIPVMFPPSMKMATFQLLAALKTTLKPQKVSTLHPCQLNVS